MSLSALPNYSRFLQFRRMCLAIWFNQVTRMMARYNVNVHVIPLFINPIEFINIIYVINTMD